MKQKLCLRCSKKLERAWQFKFCSITCSLANIRSNRKSVNCPYCDKQLKASWNKHITHCEEKQLQKQNKKQDWINSLRKNRVKPIKCLGCVEDFMPTYFRVKFCSVDCYRKNSSVTFTDDRRKKLSKSTSRQMYLRYEQGWEPTCGRAKKYDYESPYAGKVKLDGLWEVSFAKYLDAKNINWQRNRKRFSYIKPDGNKSTYQPDFYIVGEDGYVEVKGYETKLDRCKWSQFEGKLAVIREAEIMKIREGKLIEWSDWIANPSVL